MHPLAAPALGKGHFVEASLAQARPEVPQTGNHDPDDLKFHVGTGLIKDECLHPGGRGDRHAARDV